MGGIGSGRHSDIPSPVLDDLPKFSIDHFARHHGLDENLDQEYSLPVGGSIAVTTTPNTIRFGFRAPTWREPDRSIFSAHRLERIPCVKGGFRARLTCGLSRTNAQRCQNQCRVLYFLDGQPMCRQCCGLPYRSQQYDPFGLAFTHLHRLRARLGASPGAGVLVPPRPRYMHHLTYLRLSAETIDVFNSLCAHQTVVQKRLLARLAALQSNVGNSCSSPRPAAFAQAGRKRERGTDKPCNGERTAS